MNLIERAKRFYQRNGARALPKKGVSYLHRKFVRPWLPDVVGERRVKLGRDLLAKSGGTVLAGPLEGYKVNPDPRWGAGDLGPMLLGTYEKAILEKLIEFGRSADLLIDIGAADGLFGVGLVAKGYFDRSACFEMEPAMRRALSAVAKLNAVEGKVTILGVADERLITQLAKVGVSLSNAVVLCDIEGAEFDLLTSELIEAFKTCPMIVELHEDYFEDGQERLASLIERAERHFTLSFMDQGPRELPDHEYVRHLIETDRWLLTSEGRCINQRWLIMRPRTGSNHGAS
jgi:hypothetical protein